VDDPDEVGPYGDCFVAEAYVEEVDSSTNGVALRVEPEELCPVRLIHRDLLNPALEGNRGAIGIAQHRKVRGVHLSGVHRGCLLRFEWWPPATGSKRGF
jgi:hypothetical protein